MGESTSMRGQNVFNESAFTSVMPQYQVDACEYRVSAWL